MKIYRYFSAKWGIESLRSRRLKASDPKHFNDPFEISPNFDVKRFDRNFVRRIMLQEHMIEDAWCRLAPNIYPNYSAFRSHWIDTIDERVDAKLPEVRENIREIQEDFLRGCSQRGWRIISFSRVVDSILLWSHYGDSHRGIALGFDAENRIITNLGVENFLEVRYSSKKPDFEPWDDFDGFERELRKSIRSKSLEWSYQEEVRALLVSDALKDDLYPFDGDSVESVYVSANCRQADLTAVAEILSHKDYEKTVLYRGPPSRTSYKLDFQKIDLNRAP